MFGIIAQQFQMFRRGVERRLCVVLIVLCGFQILHCDGAVIEQELRAVQCLARKKLVGDGLAIRVVTARDIVASDAEQQLAFLDRVAEARADIHDASRGQRDHRHRASNVGIHRSVYHQLRRRFVQCRRRQRIALRMIDGKVRYVEPRNHGRGRWRFRCGVVFRLATGREHDQENERPQSVNLRFLHLYLRLRVDSDSNVCLP